MQEESCKFGRRSSSLTKDDYRDGIHINNSGQRKLANVMKQEFARKLE